METFEKQLEDLKSSRDDGDMIKGKIGKCFVLVSKTLLHKPFEHKIKSIRDFEFPL
jgi:hypothetical protein